MIQKIQRRFFLMTVGLLTLVMAVVCVSVIVTIKAQNAAESNKILDGLLLAPTFPGDRPEGHKGNQMNAMRSFLLILDDADNIIRAEYNADFFTQSQIDELLNAALVKNRTSGSIGDYDYRFSATTAEGRRFAAVDVSLENRLFQETALVVSVACLAGLGVLALIAWGLSLLIVKPLRTAFDRQRRFVSDASHELKTPLTVISASCDLLSKEVGENKWLGQIQSQLVRMNALVIDLLNLAKLDEGLPPVRTEIELSRQITQTALSFDAVCFEAGKQLELDIQPELKVVSDHSAVQKLTSILLDNAVKYCDPHGTITVRLALEGRPTLWVTNTGCTIKEEEKQKLFERFYRAESARDRQSGGSGLGLAIAAAIAKANRFKLDLICLPNQSTTFRVIF